ncbi:helix-turn-helix transcriptional regulator [Kamptonema sp. UHCC 0994]|jgi:HTH-type transcriptional regulator, competence development regulator|uniref:helix-turn-helix domain-containing protein n=1 Tax=Kamptonema sp. UHCC 0994 TaxID=3031329 RepID=UPI0023B91E9F|nr:helix-turn-helix transcriptional regulator [Kamptonema sp. UHCC 0994]MDF0553410.1 helix-turn-helix transcriptional regulator [Kamptonema sp. UHCC 0994]
MSQNFGKLIRQARQGKGYSQRDLAKLVEVDYTYLSKLENDRADYPPREEVIQSLAHHLDLDVKDLRDRAGRITPEDAKVVQELVKKYPKQIPVLFRQMRDHPDLAQKFIREATQSENEEKES